MSSPSLIKELVWKIYSPIPTHVRKSKPDGLHCIQHRFGAGCHLTQVKRKLSFPAVNPQWGYLDLHQRNHWSSLSGLDQGRPSQGQGLGSSLSPGSWLQPVLSEPQSTSPCPPQFLSPASRHWPYLALGPGSGLPRMYKNARNVFYGAFVTLKTDTWDMRQPNSQLGLCLIGMPWS